MIDILIKEKFEVTSFSNNERVIVDYILEQKMAIKDMTTKDIADATYTSPSSLVRIAKKMGYEGWNALKDDYLEEVAYLETHFVEIDANYPFKRNDNIMSIANKIAKLKQETLADTLSLITHDELQKAIQLLRKANMIHVFAVSNNCLIAQEFKHNMHRIQKHVEIHSLQSELIFEAVLAKPDDVAIIISYSGETGILNKVANALKANHIPVIALTNIGISTLSQCADCVLRVTTRERLYSKIATFTIDEAFIYLLDVLYSCLFALDYDRHSAIKIQTSKMVETGRFSDLDILKEDK